MKVFVPNLGPSVGDLEANAAQVAAAIRDAHTAGASVLVTPELAISGYPPRDLLFREGFLVRCEEAIAALAAEVPADLLAIIGGPRRDPQGRVRGFNSLAACRDGKVVAVADKQLLPGYDVFDEDRYFLPGSAGTWIDHRGVRIGLLVCEDLWQGNDAGEASTPGLDPVADLAEAGCGLIVAASASPFVVGKHERQRSMLMERAAQHDLDLLVTNQRGAEDDLIFDGWSCLVRAGGDVTWERPPFTTTDPVVDAASTGSGSRPAGMPADEARFRALVSAVRTYADRVGHQPVLLGLSGGIDSAVTAAIAVAAVGADRVTGVIMPSEYSSDHSVRDARELAERLGLATCLEIPIESIHRTVTETLNQADGSVDVIAEGSLADQNIQARARGLVLMALSNARGGLVLSTGNKSEVAVGYVTLYGDMCGALAVLGDVLKGDVYGLARWMNDHPAEGPWRSAPIPESTITKPPSAELRPDQLDEDSLPPYAVLDDIVRRWIEEEQSAARIIEETQLAPSLVQEILRMIDLAQFKRDQAAVIPKLSRRAFGRGRPWPIIGRPGGAPVWIPDPAGV